MSVAAAGGILVTVDGGRWVSASGFGALGEGLADRDAGIGGTCAGDPPRSIAMDSRSLVLQRFRLSKTVCLSCSGVGGAGDFAGTNSDSPLTCASSFDLVRFRREGPVLGAGMLSLVFPSGTGTSSLAETAASWLAP